MVSATQRYKWVADIDIIAMLNPNVIAELDGAQVETEGGVVEGVDRIAAESYQFEENYSARLGDAYLFRTPNGGYRVRASDVRDVREL